MAGNIGLAACSSIEVTTPPPPEDQGSYNAVVSGGDLNVSLTGNAIFGVQTNLDGINEFVLFLSTGQVPSSTFDVITMFREETTLPEPDTYTIYDTEQGAPLPEDFLAAYVFSDQTSFGAFLTGSGTLTIQASSDEEITGTFEFVGVLDENSALGVFTDSVSVSGSFEAVPGIIPN